MAHFVAVCLAHRKPWVCLPAPCELYAMAPTCHLRLCLATLGSRKPIWARDTGPSKDSVMKVMGLRSVWEDTDDMTLPSPRVPSTEVTLVHGFLFLAAKKTCLCLGEPLPALPALPLLAPGTRAHFLYFAVLDWALRWLWVFPFYPEC